MKFLSIRNSSSSEQCSVYFIIIMMPAYMDRINIFKVLYLVQFFQSYPVGTYGNFQAEPEYGEKDAYHFIQKRNIVERLSACYFDPSNSVFIFEPPHHFFEFRGVNAMLLPGIGGEAERAGCRAKR